jgi:eukaryotic-like serine/threonine-protein kinase
LNDGAAIWQKRLGGEGGESDWSATTPAVKMTSEGMGIIVAGSGDGRMSALDLADGRVLWTHVSDPTIYKVSPYRRDTRPLLSSPTIAGDKVFFGSADGHLYGLDLATGKKLWSFAVGAPVMSTPTISGNALFVAAYDGRLYAFTAAQDAAR